MKKLIIIPLVLLIVASCASTSKTTSSRNSERINVGYGTISKDANTYAISEKKLNDKERTSYSNIYEYLRGKVPGVDVRPDNSIIIRGIGTNSGHTDPLFIVDGMEVDNIGNIPPSVIESVTVLKDASASIYGTRSANGVILIETKR